MSSGLLPDPFFPRQRTGTINPANGAISGPTDLDPAQIEAAQIFK